MKFLSLILCAAILALSAFAMAETVGTVKVKYTKDTVTSLDLRIEGEAAQRISDFLLSRGVAFKNGFSTGPGQSGKDFVCIKPPAGQLYCYLTGLK